MSYRTRSTHLRRTLVTGAAVLSTAGTLLATAPSATAVAVDGSVGAGGTVAHNGSCQIDEPGVAFKYRPLVAPGPARTTRFVGDYAAWDPTFATATGGHVESTSTGDATARRGTVQRVVLTAKQLVRLRNTGAYDCGLELAADTQSGAALKVRGRGKLRIAWDNTGPGQFADLYLARFGGPTLITTSPTTRSGVLTANVRRGRYYLFVQFRTAVREAGLEVGGLRKKVARFKVVATYRR